MKWPLAPWVICLAAGIVLADVWSHSILWPASAMGLALILAWCKQAQTKRYIPWMLCFVAGWTSQVLHTTIYSRDDLRVVLPAEAQLVTVEGRVSSIPNQRMVETKQGPKQKFSTTIDVSRLQRSGEWIDVAGTIYVQASSALPEGLTLNSKVKAFGVLSPPPEAAAPGLFDFRSYLARQNIHFQLRTIKAADWEIVAGAHLYTAWLQGFRDWAMGTLQRYLPLADENVMLMQAMALGWKGGLTEEMSDSFVKTGTMHLFAISGLHVALIAVILVELARALNAPRWLCAVIILPLLWFYTAATGWQASAIRATIMATVICAGWMLERPSNMLNSLATSACLILLLDPQQLFQAGFQLSFMVVLSMGLLSPLFEEWRQKIAAPDPFLPEQLRPLWQRWLDGPLKFVTVNFVASLSAWLGSLPLIAYYFHIVTPVSLLANLVLVPLSSLVLMANVGSLLLWWFSPAVELFNLCGWGVMRLMVWCSEHFAQLPYGWSYLAAPSLLAITLYYAMLFPAFASGWKSPWRWRIAGVAGCLLAVCLWHNWWQRTNQVSLTILDMRGGDAHWFAGGHKYPSLLIDTGSAEAYDSTLKEFLQIQGISRVPEVLLTHGDVRHVGGAPVLLEEFYVEKLAHSPVPSRSPGYRQVIRDWEKEHIIVSAGTNLGPWEVLHPQAGDKFSSGDDNAVVLRGTFEGIKILLLSDLGRLGQRALLERQKDLRADIVVTGLPAKEEPLNNDLLAAIQPQVIIVTSATQPALEQISANSMERLRRGIWKPLFLHKCGSVSISFNKDGTEIFTLYPVPESFIIQPATGSK